MSKAYTDIQIEEIYNQANDYGRLLELIYPGSSYDAKTLTWDPANNQRAREDWKIEDGYVLNLSRLTCVSTNT